MRKGRKTIIVTSFVVLAAALLFVLFQLFRVRSIMIEGSASEAYIKSICGIEKGDSVFLVDKQAALDAIETDPWLKAVSVSVVYPDKIKIQAEQRQIAAYIKKEDVILAIDKECIVLRTEQTEKTDFPLITGVKMDVFEVGKVIGCPDVFMIGVLERLLAILEDSELRITQIDASFAANLVVKTNEGLMIELGDDTELPQKLKLAGAAIEELKKRGYTFGILDVSSVTTAYYREN